MTVKVLPFNIVPMHLYPVPAPVLTFSASAVTLAVSPVAYAFSCDTADTAANRKKIIVSTSNADIVFFLIAALFVNIKLSL